MPKTVAVLTLVVTMLASAGFANSATGTAAGPGRSPVIRPTPKPSPAAPAQAPVVSNVKTTLIHWDKFYDRHGNPLPAGPQENVGADSLYFKEYNVLDTLYGCPKSQVPNPAPAHCRTGLAFLNEQTRVGMDPQGTYIYEVYDTTLRCHNSNDGSHIDYTIANGTTACRTDGDFLYALVGDTVFKYLEFPQNSGIIQANLLRFRQLH